MGKAAMKRYRLLHQQYPEREFYFIHTSRDALDIQVQQWLGIRAPHATDTNLTEAEAIINLQAMNLTFNG